MFFNSWNIILARFLHQFQEQLSCEISGAIILVPECLLLYSGDNFDSVLVQRLSLKTQHLQISTTLNDFC